MYACVYYVCVCPCTHARMCMYMLEVPIPSACINQMLTLGVFLNHSTLLFKTGLSLDTEPADLGQILLSLSPALGLQTPAPSHLSLSQACCLLRLRPSDFTMSTSPTRPAPRSPPLPIREWRVKPGSACVCVVGKKGVVRREKALLTRPILTFDSQWWTPQALATTGQTD